MQPNDPVFGWPVSSKSLIPCHAMPSHPIPSPGGKHKSLFLLGFGGGLGDFNIGEVFLADSTEGVEVWKPHISLPFLSVFLSVFLLGDRGEGGLRQSTRTNTNTDPAERKPCHCILEQIWPTGS